MKNVLNLLLFLLLVSCVQIKSQSSLPTWYLNPPQNSQTNNGFLYGVGYGSNLDIAKQTALSDLSQKIITEVSANFETTRQESSNGNDSLFASSSKQKITSSLRKMSIPNYNIIESQQLGEFIYVLVKVDKAQLIEHYEQRIKEAEKEINLIVGNFSNYLIEKKHSLFRIQEIINANYDNVTILNALDQNNQSIAQIREIFEIIQKFEEETDNNLLIYLNPNQNEEAIINFIGQALTSENLTLSDSDGSGYNYANIMISSENSSKKVYGMYLLKKEVTIKTFSGNNNLIATNTLKLSGSSNVSFRNAELNLARNLQQKIANGNIYEILNLTR